MRCLLGALGAAVLPVAAATPATAAAGPPRFVAVASLPSSTELPSALSCARPSFCLELASGVDEFQLLPTVLVSGDAGRSWHRAAALPLGVVLAGHGDFAFVFGGQTLDASDVGVQCDAPGDCVAGGGHGLLASTSDGARRWTLRGNLPARWSLGVNVACLADGACLAVGRYGHRVRTAWLGARERAFRLLPAPLPAGFVPEAIACPSASRCLVAGTTRPRTGELLVTHRLGRSVRWALVATTRHRVLRSLACPSATTCFALADTLGPRDRVERVVVARSLDGGLRWRTVVSAGAPVAPTAIDCASTSDCATSVVLPASNGGVLSESTSFGAPGVPLQTAYTTDGGAHWAHHTILETTDPGSSPAFGACLGPGRCVAAATGDTGGTTEVLASSRWKVVETDGSGTAIPSIACTSGSSCELVEQLQGTDGYAARLLASDDGGLSYSGVRLPRGDEPVVAAGCQGPQRCEVVAVRGVGLAEGQEGNDDYDRAAVVLLSTTDGGATWSASTLAGPGWIPLDASCSSPVQCTVVVSSSDGDLADLVSTQDGSTWTETPVDPPDEGLELLGPGGAVVTCGPGGTCLYSSSSFFGASTLLRSDDGGATWTVATPPGPQGQLEVVGASCTSPLECAVATDDFGGSGVGDARLYLTTDGGATWSSAASVPPPGTEPSSDALALSCWAAGACAVLTGAGVATTLDGGTSWTEASLPVTASELPLLGLIGASPTLSCGGPTTCSAVLSVGGGPLGLGAVATKLFALRG